MRACPQFTPRPRQFMTACRQFIRPFSSPQGEDLERSRGGFVLPLPSIHPYLAFPLRGRCHGVTDEVFPRIMLRRFTISTYSTSFVSLRSTSSPQGEDLERPRGSCSEPPPSGEVARSDGRGERLVYFSLRATSVPASRDTSPVGEATEEHRERNVRAAGFRSSHAACGISRCAPRNISRPWTYRALAAYRVFGHIASLDIPRAAVFHILFLAKGKERQRPLFFRSPLRPTPYSSVGTAFLTSPPLPRRTRVTKKVWFFYTIIPSSFWLKRRIFLHGFFYNNFCCFSLTILV